MRDFNIKKLYYSVSEVSKITEVEQYVLRYWESEFEELKPQKNRAGNRAYTNKDIQLILIIKYLLRDRKFTLGGAKQMLQERGIDGFVSTLEGVIEREKSAKQPIKKSEKTASAPEKVEINNPEPKEMISLDKMTVRQLRTILLDILDIL